MILTFFKGFVLGGSLIVAIGAQNAFLLKQGLLRQHVLILCFLCALSDAVLMAVGIAGMGAFIENSPNLLIFIRVGGAMFLFWHAYQAFIRMKNPQGLEAQKSGSSELMPAIMTWAGFTFLNPHVYLDTVLLVGGISASYEGDMRLAFGMGAITSSFVWFFSLGYGAKLLTPFFESLRAWQILDGFIGVIMATIAISLIWPLITT